MKKLIYFLMLLLAVPVYSQDEQEITEEQLQVVIDSLENSLHYKTGTIELSDGNATITVPEGFKYLDPEQSKTVIVDYWGNMPEQAEGVLGMLLPENKGLLRDDSWAFIITYEDMGYVKDDDADDIDYDELEEEIKKGMEEENKQRIEMGYEPMHFIGWAEPPYYDKEKKVLHWAKEIQVGDEKEHTLNYNLRMLGRKGVFMFNAVANVKNLPEVNQNIDKVLNSVQFKEGFKYTDFDPDVDEVAKWTIGGLIAGKVLAKAGFFAVILKFWKIIAVAIAGLFGFRKKKKKDDKQEVLEASTDTDETPETSPDETNDNQEA